ncbi:hypothetical protein T440DRAFT_304146 [Plenodomus tracheiphilus IPT5]|uniref:Nuclear pore complex protein Nup85 n=1 Tax=Plenodomus tracheiphilus IPT5 TaxID=1408161 RepID=A0A6A7BD93_9PLEO|nr:hypothetical protein T440DRAFT_304146 [Plenodomus tracheiphilus IPT5]
MFRFNDPEPPSTPGRYRRESRNGPSTTPAGPPPDKSLLVSSTPAEPPPKRHSLFDPSSRPSFDKPVSYGFGDTFFASSPPKHDLFEGIGSGSIGTSSNGRPSIPRGRPTSGGGGGGGGGLGGGFQVPDTSSDDGLDRDAEGESDDDDLDHDDEYDDDDYDDEDEPHSAQRRAKPQNSFSQSVVSRASTNDMDPGPTLVRAGVKQNKFDFVALAKSQKPSSETAVLQDSDHAILETERLLEKVYDSIHSGPAETRADVLSVTVRDLVALWHASSKTASKGNPSSSRPGAISGLTHASRLADLLLSIHHPPPLEHTQRTSALSLVPSRSESKTYTPIPKVMLDWLNSTYSGMSEVDMVLKEARGFSKHPSFWEAVHITVVRGCFAETLKLLQGANLEFAESAQHDGLGNTGYTGAHLRYANDALRAAIDLVRECPAFANGDWDIKGHDWTIFRTRVHQTYNGLEEMAEGESASRHSISQPFQASHFGISQTQASFQLSVASRKAESKVPWTVYENLRKLYQLMLGNEEEILTISADWIEAALGLSIWWNGEEEESPAQGTLAASRRSLMRSQRVRSVDVTPVKAYCQRLSAALAAVTASCDDEFGVNITDHFEIGLASILDDNPEAVLQIIRGWSLTMASAVAEVANAGGWFTRANGLMDQFDQSDLMVLSYNEQQPKGVSKDDLQISYANVLASKGQLTGQDGQTSREGWEIAIQVLGRLDDSITANERIERILNELPLESAVRVDKITRLCHSMGLEQHALTIAQKYADHLRANTHSYGDTLLYYARAHDTPHIQEVLRILVSHCLVKSAAYPPVDELDESLSSLITSPKQTLTNLATLDPEAASLLSNHLSGYATIRKFYDLRDEEVLLKAGEKPAHRPMARKRAAANALMVIIASAASSIRGGLYDPEIETVVQVDVLLPLLGEALVFINQPKRTLTLQHLYSLLSALEDLDTAPSMIRTQCEEVLRTTLHAAHASSTLSSSSHLQHSTSNISSTYSLINSTDLQSTGASASNSVAHSAVMGHGGGIGDVRRGWDWRKGFGQGKGGEDVLRVLRLGVAREVARAFADGEV